MNARQNDRQEYHAPVACFSYRVLSQAVGLSSTGAADSAAESSPAIGMMDKNPTPDRTDVIRYIRIKRRFPMKRDEEMLLQIGRLDVFSL